MLRAPSSMAYGVVSSRADLGFASGIIRSWIGVTNVRPPKAAARALLEGLGHAAGKIKKLIHNGAKYRGNH